MFDYREAFSRNIGWVTAQEQERLRNATVAIGGLGGVGGDHSIVCARMGIGNFRISDMDTYDLVNFNRQAGASMRTLGRPKSEVMVETLHDINPEANIKNFPEGINEANLDDFLDGVDVYIDSLDIFAIDIRRKVFQRCYEKNIPAITAAPMGMGTSMLVFMPGKMSFEEYFCLEGLNKEDQIIYFVMGVSPSMQQRHYLVFERSVNFLKKKVPSVPMGISLAAGVLCTNVLKLLLNRGEVIHAPKGMHFDAYRNKLVKTWRPWGNKNPIQKYYMYPKIKEILKSGEHDN
ncbi:ThiF family adenylyltransferase [Aliiglaciecola sp. CAU 1673]|uniref:ThiF family adenylyltransferase n=1 Tax=Aliiglaciecola sp. CAU 1673 TaxID=3032595 RepID=UPI0023DBC66D|nr:ThiF family adenylyltransferase [Aliiglaciecola sp. CAU 1673]MDF2177323.1 ThiF family adenylyltransferase [Aliiglaciecola sp. CAU 1673]